MALRRSVPFGSAQAAILLSFFENAEYAFRISKYCISIAAGRMGAPEEVAQLALHIAEDCNYLNGQIITLDGGWI